MPQSQSHFCARHGILLEGVGTTKCNRDDSRSGVLVHRTGKAIPCFHFETVINNENPIANLVWRIVTVGSIGEGAQCSVF